MFCKQGSNWGLRFVVVLGLSQVLKPILIIHHTDRNFVTNPVETEHTFSTVSTNYILPYSACNEKIWHIIIVDMFNGCKPALHRLILSRKLFCCSNGEKMSIILVFSYRNFGATTRSIHLARKILLYAEEMETQITKWLQPRLHNQTAAH